MQLLRMHSLLQCCSCTRSGCMRGKIAAVAVPNGHEQNVPAHPLPLLQKGAVVAFPIPEQKGLCLTGPSRALCLISCKSHGHCQMKAVPASVCWYLARVARMSDCTYKNKLTLQRMHKTSIKVALYILAEQPAKTN